MHKITVHRQMPAAYFQAIFENDRRHRFGPLKQNNDAHRRLLMRATRLLFRDQKIDIRDIRKLGTLALYAGHYPLLGKVLGHLWLTSIKDLCNQKGAACAITTDIIFQQAHFLKNEMKKNQTHPFQKAMTEAMTLCSPTTPVEKKLHLHFSLDRS